MFNVIFAVLHQLEFEKFGLFFAIERYFRFRCFYLGRGGITSNLYPYQNSIVCAWRQLMMMQLSFGKSVHFTSSIKILRVYFFCCLDGAADLLRPQKREGAKLNKRLHLLPPILLLLTYL